MSARLFNLFLPPAVKGADYARLDAIPPETGRKAVGPVDRSKQPRRLRGLSAKQELAFDGLLGRAVYNIQREAKERKGLWLRRFDHFHESGMRTYQQRWDALARIAGPMLARINLTTMMLGYFNEHGQFVLNRQRGLSEDSGVNEWTVSRLLTDLERAKYINRRFRRIWHNGKRWITRVTINVRPRFFIDLGLGHLLANARNVKKTEDKAALGVIKGRQDAARMEEQAAAVQRRKAQEQYKRKKDAQAAAQAAERHADYRAQWVIARADFAISSGLKEPQLSREFARRFPQFAMHPDML